MPNFDPSPLYDHVAQNLMTRFGADAILLTERALAQIAPAEDEEAYRMWRGVHAALKDYLLAGGHGPAGAYVH